MKRQKKKSMDDPVDIVTLASGAVDVHAWLHDAVAHRHATTVALLLKRGASVDFIILTLH